MRQAIIEQRTLHYDRDERLASFSTGKSRFQFYFMNLSHKFLFFVNYLGVTRIHRAFNRIMRIDGFTTISEDGVEFTFPSNDYYWNRLLSTNWRYEPELDDFLRQVANIPFVFVDLGANYGYWSTRVGGGVYGSHRLIAVEASGHCFSYLQRNAGSLQGDISLVHAAIEQVSGKEMKLYGSSHAGLSLVNVADAAQAPFELVTTKSLDDLMIEHGVDTASVPTIVKLDVEGVEELALRGGKETVAGMSAFVIEDLGFGVVGEAVDYVRSELGMQVYAMRPGEIQRLETREDIVDEKRKIPRIQQVGVNFLATSSDFWKRLLNEASAKQP